MILNICVMVTKLCYTSLDRWKNRTSLWGKIIHYSLYAKSIFEYLQTLKLMFLINTLSVYSNVNVYTKSHEQKLVWCRHLVLLKQTALPFSGKELPFNRSKVIQRDQTEATLLIGNIILNTRPCKTLPQ